MLDFIIYILIGFILLFSTIGFSKYSPTLLVMAAVFSIIVTIGLFNTGWQSYSVSTYTITQIDNNYSATQTPLQILPKITGTSEQQAIYAISTFMLLVTLALIGGTFQMKRTNSALSIKRDLN